MAAFDNAYRQFYESLPIVERNHYVPKASPEEVLEALEQLRKHAKHRQKQRIAQSLTRVSKTIKGLEQYFKVVDIMIQSHPEYAALVWGAMRFLLQLVSNFSTFYDKLIAALERLAIEIGQYEVIGNKHTNSSERVRNCLEKIYFQIFQFFQTTARIFVSHNKLKSTLSVIGDLIWKSFDDRFGDILERISSYRELIKLEISLMNARALENAELIAREEFRLATEERFQAEKARAKAEEDAAVVVEVRELVNQQRKDLLVDRIIQWLAAPEFAEIPSHAQTLREDGTSRWIFEHPQFLSWKDNQWSIKPDPSGKLMGGNTLWIYGNPGSGKTILASSILQELQSCRSTLSGTPNDICYFFFESKTIGTATTAVAYRAILTQIVHRFRHDEDVLDKFSFVLGSSGSTGSPRATSGELGSLFKLCLQHLPMYVLLDGIDECDGVDDLLRDLLWVSSNSSTKMLLFGRTNISNMNRYFPSDRKLAMDRSALSKDISVFLTSQITIMVEDELLPENTDVAELVSCLSQGADGMFLWARLMIKYLSSTALTPLERIRTVHEVILPEGLDQMYQRIANLIAKPGKTQLRLAQKIITWAAASVEPLPLEDLHDVLTFADCGLDGHKYRDFRETVSVVCGGLVECYTPRESRKDDNNIVVIRCIHLSVMEHFLPGPLRTCVQESMPLCLSSEPAVHLELAEQCIKYIQHFKPHMELGKPIYSGVEPGTFAAYAARNWCRHISNAFVGKSAVVGSYLWESPAISEFEDTAISVLTTLRRFLEDPCSVKYWAEMYHSNLEDISPDYKPHHLEFYSHLHQYLYTIPPKSKMKQSLQHLLDALQEWNADMTRLTQDWGARLTKNPGLIWEEIPAFLCSRYLGSSPDSKVISLGPTPSSCIKSSSRALCTISRTAANSQLTAVLTIWPSKLYEESGESIKFLIDNYRFREAEISHDWIATYEVWEHEHHRRKIIDMSIPLCAKEVALLLRQSSRIKSTDTWSLSFPLAISSELTSIVILRTLYACHLAEDGVLKFVQSIRVSMNQNSRLQSRWNPYQTSLPGDWYSYKFTFSPGDNHLLFQERNHTNQDNIFYLDPCDDNKSEPRLFGKILGESGTILSTALFKIERDSELEVRCVGLLEDGAPVINAIFHPFLPYIVLNFGGSIEVWTYNDMERCHLRRVRKEIKEMTFSSCGDYLLVKEADPQPVSVIPLPENLRHGALRSTNSEVKDLQEKRLRNFTAQPILHSKDVFDSSFRPGQILHNPTVISASPSSLNSLSFRSGNAVTMDLSSTCANYQKISQSFEIISLPQWEGMQHTTPTIIVPSSEQMSVKIVLNKSHEEEYALSKPVDMGLPLVITRDVHAIRKVVAKDLKPSEIRMLPETEEPEEFNGRDKLSTGHKNITKRKLDIAPEIGDGQLEVGAYGEQSPFDDGGDGASGDFQHFKKKRTS